MNQLDFSGLPNLPQCDFLRKLATDLWEDSTVLALWLGGSLARGAGDADSDVDLRVVITPETFNATQMPKGAWRLEANAATFLPFRFGEQAVLFHTLLRDGQIYDLFVQSATEEIRPETRLILGCRDENLRPSLESGADPVTRFTPAAPETVREILCSFWISQRKHIKALHRDLPILAWEGEHRLRQDLLRLWFILATSNDCGPVSRATIHTFSPVVRAVQEYIGLDALRNIGQPIDSVEALLTSTSWLREEVSRVGHMLAERMDFAYPETAEVTIRQCWNTYEQERAGA